MQVLYQLSYGPKGAKAGGMLVMIPRGIPFRLARRPCLALSELTT
jgi:hypothetical protein